MACSIGPLEGRLKKSRRGGVLGTIALISTAMVLVLWFKRTGERHERAFAEQQVRLGIHRSPVVQRHKIEAAV